MTCAVLCCPVVCCALQLTTTSSVPTAAPVGYSRHPSLCPSLVGVGHRREEQQPVLRVLLVVQLLVLQVRDARGGVRMSC